MSNANEMANLFLKVRSNPTSMIRLALSNLEALTNGKIALVDASNPVALALDTMCSIGSAVMMNAETQTRRLYPSAATSFEDLYYHMTDRDYLDRFAKPSRTIMQLIMPLDDLNARAVEVPNSGGVRKITIPKHTEVNVADSFYTMQYAVDIRVMPHGGYSVVFDTSEESPIYSVTENQLAWGITTQSNQSYMIVEIPIWQMRITSFTAALTAASGFTRDYGFSDSFFYCRAFIRGQTSSTWTEIRTSHNEMVYDPNVPTAILSVKNQALGVTIPNVYFRSGLIQDMVRIDIYTTKGAFEARLSGISPDSFVRQWRDLDRNTSSIYRAPLDLFSNSVSFFSTYTVGGGSAGLNFNQLRQRVISGGLTQRIPVTGLQLNSTVTDMGYSIVKDIDNITARQFLVTRAIPAPTDGTTVTSIGCAVQTFLFNSSAIDSRLGILDHGNRITLTPKTLYENVNGRLELVGVSEFQSLTDGVTFTPDQLTSIVNGRELLYSPFFQILDISTTEISTRAYRLERPRVTSKREFQSNAAAGIDVVSSGYGAGLNPDGSGFIVEVDLTAGPTFREFTVDRINLQLSFVSQNGGERVYIPGFLTNAVGLDGKPIDGNYTYRFYINTGFDINRSHQIIHEPTGATFDLTTEFDLVYVVSDYLPVGVSAGDIDSIVSPSDFSNYNPSSIYLGILQEKLTIQFGQHLEYLWAKNRTIASSVAYKRYEDDIPAMYSENLYRRDSMGNIILENDGNGGYSLIVEHEKGDPILTESGLPVLAHRKGDVMLDDLGNPIPLSGIRSIDRLIDLVLLDARYYFATDSKSVQYRRDSIQVITDWLLSDVPLIANMVYERTRVFFHPKTSIGSIVVVDENGTKHTERAEQFLSIIVYVDDVIKGSPEIQEIISAKIRSTVVESLKKSISSTSNLIDDLRDALGDDVKTIVVNGLFGDRYNVVRLEDESLQPTVGKKLQVLSNLTMQVVDSLEIDYRTIG